MPDKIKYSIIVTPIENITRTITYSSDEETSVHPDVTESYDVLATEIGTTLGCTGEAAVNDYVGYDFGNGYLNRTPYYFEADDDTDISQNPSSSGISTHTSATFIWIKNTGNAFVDGDHNTLGEPLPDTTLKVMLGTVMISILNAGEAVVFKDDNIGLNAQYFNVRTVDSTGDNDNTLGHLAVEFLVAD